MAVEKDICVKPKGHSNLAKDLEKLDRRIQAIKIHIRESAMKTQKLEASLQAAMQTREAIIQKHHQ